MEFPKVILPLACLPNIEFLSWMMHAPEVLIEVNETFPKQTCRNRYAIMTAAGPSMLTIPVKRPHGNHTSFKDISVDLPSKWVNLHWRTIESAYNKSPFFLYYRDGFEMIYRNPAEKLVDLNRQFLDVTLKYIGINKSYSFTSEYYKNYPENVSDMRQHIMPKKMSTHSFSIKKYNPYIQVFTEIHPFATNLSALDLLFNLGPEAATYLLHHPPGK
jgi:hypothetical protein